MECPACGSTTVPFTVPLSFRDDAPEGAPAVGICPTCLTLTPIADASEASPPEEAAFGRIIEGFPTGESGAAMALGVGLLVDSLALNRDAVRRLFEVVADGGDDPWLVLERLAVAGTVQPTADLGRLRRQLEQLWG